MSRSKGRGPSLKAVATVTAVALVVAVLFVTPPASVIEALAHTFSSALVDPSDSAAGVTSLAARSLELYVNSALASYVADRSIRSGLSDQEMLGRIMAAVRESTLSPTQIPHAVRARSALIAGFGYCDQVNDAVARVAAHYFRAAQIFALYDATRHVSPHTIGRVWSDERQAWLYFDAFFSVPVVFTREQHDAPVVVGAAIPSRGTPPPGLYRLDGWVINEYRPSFGGQVAVKVWNRLGLGAIEPPPADAVDQTLTDLTGPHDEAVFERVARAYASARVDHLVSKAPNRAAYLGIANDASAVRDERAAEFAAAARVFATPE